MKYLMNKTKYIFLFILSISFLGCEEEDEANLPEVVAGFTFIQSETTGTVTFTNISEEAQLYEWDFGNGTTSTEINPIRTFAEGTFTVSLKASNIAGASNTFEDQITIDIPDTMPDFDSGLLTNGGFEAGGDSWTGNALNVQTEGGNSFNLANVETAGNPFDVNLSQVVAITQGTNYILSFDASSDQARTMLAGIGLNEAPFTNTTVEVDLTTDMQTFTLQLSAADFGGANSRVLFDMGAAVGTVVIDNVSLVEGGDGSDSNTGGDSGSLEACDGGELVNDFETADDSIFNNFGGGVGSIIDNADTSVNSSAKLGQYVKNAGEVFGGITIALENNIALNNGTFTIDVNSTSVRQLLFKLEGLNQELILPTSGAGWETISYDFTGQSGEVTGITLIMDNGTQGDGTADWTIQFDNIRLCGNESSGGGNALEACDGGELVNDFETADDSIFNNFGGGVGSIIDNADTSVNSSAKLGQYVKNAGEVFGGITIALENNIALNNGTFTIDVNSTSVRQLLFKLEGLNQELILPTSGAGWETISYDFTGQSGEVTGITLIMDNGTQGDGTADWTIQFDNIRLCGNESSGGGGTCTPPAAGEFITDGGFEQNAGCWQLINNGGTVTISTTVNNGGSNSGQIKTTPGSNPALKQERVGAGTITPNTTYVVQFDIQASTTDVPADGAVFQAFTFSEPAEGSTDPAVQHVLVTGDASFPTTWETRTYTFTTAASVDGGVSLLLELVCGGAGTCTGTINIDNVSITAQ
ncbi:carbohydrate binding domain-containing protein [Croceitalea marina]|uniref:Carbohydrate binding domain-containing protein n=1 Tax=Croceitalea marina TaxID=1775166 RepID=A0ABW5MT22_9FLAO